MSAMFTALHPEHVKNLILLAAGIDFSTREGLINLWSDAKNFDVDAFVDDVGNCPADFLQSCFLMLSPVRNLLGKPLSLLERMDDAQVRRRVPHHGKPGSTTTWPCRARSFATS